MSLAAATRVRSCPKAPHVRPRFAVGFLCLVLGGCVGKTPATASAQHASDLEIYASLSSLGELERVEDGCNGHSTASVTYWFGRKYGRREAAILKRLEQKYGAAAVANVPREDVDPGHCPARLTLYWRREYDAALAALEQRLGLDPRRYR